MKMKIVAWISFISVIAVVIIYMLSERLNLTAKLASSKVKITVNLGSPDRSPCWNHRKISSILEQINSSMIEIWNSWNVTNFPLFLSLMHIPETSWNRQKYKLMKLLIEENGSKKFIIGFSGSSVTAGHDNYFFESFSEVFFASINKSFASADILVEIRNQALGNNPCYPYDACAQTHLGADLDVLTWEQSMNCGRDPRPVETFTRSALRMKSNPTVIYIASGTPTWTPEDCQNFSTRDKSVLSDAEFQILSRSAKANAASASLMDGFSFLNLGAFNETTGVAPMGQSVLAISSYKCRQPYGANFSKKSPGGGHSWHPGALGHKLRGENLAYFFLGMFREAVQEVAAARPCPSGDAAASSDWDSDSTVSSIVPHLDFLDDQSEVVAAPPPLQCSDECQSEAHCFTDYLPRATNNTLSRLLVGTKGSWTIEVSFFDAAAVRKAHERHLGYRDKKLIFLSHTQGDPITFSISPTRTSSIWLCEVQKGFLRYPNWTTDLDAGSVVTIKQIPGGSNEAISLTHKVDQCYATPPVNPGSYHLTISQNGTLQVNLAYLLYW